MSAVPAPAGADLLDVARIRQDFPGLHQEVHGKPLVYLDNAATAQVPQAVIDTIVGFHTRDRANVHRGVHELSQRATAKYDAVRHTVARFLGLPDPHEIVYTAGTTDSLNLVAASWGEANLGPGDVVVVTEMEHHANLVPWQRVCARTGATLRAIPITDAGELDLDAARALIDGRVKLLSFVHVSNALGTINPVAELVAMAREVGALVCLDGAQATPHQLVDLPSLDVDFYAFSGHKVCGPTGVGILWGRKALLDAMPPYRSGGDMIERVGLYESTYQPAPLRFEAGTPNIAGVIGLGAALDYLMALGMDRVEATEQALFAYARPRLDAIDRVIPIGTAAHKAAVYGFTVKGAHPTDIGMLLDTHGIAIRTGHHCAQPVMDRYGLSATARASFAFYNTRDEVDRLADALERVIAYF